MTHLAFVTLFLGLTLGERTVELNVTGPAHHVELLLDQRVAGVMNKSPWRLGLNFGESLIPHRLVARAVDEQGNELARAEQIINLPRPPSEVQLLLDRDETGKPGTVQVIWQSLEADKPKEVTVTLDGKKIALDSDFRAKLTGIDTSVPHLMRVHAVSPSGIVAENEVAFGGGLETTSGRQLTAIPVHVVDKKKTLTLPDLESWLSIGGKPAKVIAVEEGAGDVVIVRHPRANESSVFLDPKNMVHQRPVRAVEGEGAVRNPKPQAHYVWPAPVRMATKTPTDLMPVTYPFEFTSEADFKSILVHVAFKADPAHLRYADATAVAGIRALESRRPRAVVLILGGSVRDESEMTPRQVREYLRSIGVPLFVWSFGTPTGLIEWGDITDISSANGFARAFSALRDALQNERIVWIDGEYFPSEVSLAAAGAKSIDLLATR
jgi:hypothetical protein